jgi:hypothetical protein
MKGLGMGNSMGIEGKAVISPRGFRGRRKVVRGGEKEELMSKVAKSSIGGQ